MVKTPPTYAVLPSVVASPALALKVSEGVAADGEADRRKRRVEKLRWQLRVARRAVAAKRKVWAELGGQTPPTGLDAISVAGFLVGGASALVAIQLLSALVLR